MATAQIANSCLEASIIYSNRPNVEQVGVSSAQPNTRVATAASGRANDNDADITNYDSSVYDEIDPDYPYLKETRVSSLQYNILIL